MKFKAISEKDILHTLKIMDDYEYAYEPEELPDCDHEVFTNGETIFISHSISAAKFDYWVKKIRESSGQKVDWHYMGGHACVKYVGDRGKVEEAIHYYLPVHQELYNEQLKSYSIVQLASEGIKNYIYSGENS